MCYGLSRSEKFQAFITEHSNAWFTNFCTIFWITRPSVKLQVVVGCGGVRVPLDSHDDVENRHRRLHDVITVKVSYFNSSDWL